MLLPHAGGAKSNLATGRQLLFRNLPPLQLSPVEQQLIEIRVEQSSLCGVGIAQDFQRQLCGRRTLFIDAVEASTDDAVTKVLIDEAVNRGVRSRGRTSYHVIWNKRLSSCVLEECREQDDRLRWKSRQLCE